VCSEKEKKKKRNRKIEKKQHGTFYFEDENSGIGQKRKVHLIGNVFRWIVE
jgi:hypothetical protein